MDIPYLRNTSQDIWYFETPSRDEAFFRIASVGWPVDRDARFGASID